MKDNSKKKNINSKNTDSKKNSHVSKKVVSKNNSSKVKSGKPSEKTVQKRKKNKKLLIIKIILVALLALIIVGCVAIGLFFSMIVANAPEFDPQNLYTQESSIVYAPNGDEIAKLGSEKREKITYDDLPQVLIDAIVATEDSTFFQHLLKYYPQIFLKFSVCRISGGLFVSKIF